MLFRSPQSSYKLVPGRADCSWKTDSHLKEPTCPYLTVGLSRRALGEDLLNGDPEGLEADLGWHPFLLRVGLPGMKPHLHFGNSAHLEAPPFIPAEPHLSCLQALTWSDPPTQP